MYRINNLHICKFFHDPAYSPEHITHGFSQILPSVCGHSNQSAAFCPFCFRMIKITSHRIVQSINSCISCDKDPLWILTLFQQCIRCFLSGRKMQAGSKSNGLPVKFFRIGRFHIISTKSRFHMSYRDLLVKCSQRCGKCSRCISMDQHNIRFLLSQDLPHSCKNSRCHIRKILPFFHDRHIIIRDHFKNIENLLQHFPVLSCDTHQRFQFFTFFQFQNKRAHFNCFRSCSKNHQYFFHFQFPPSSLSRYASLSRIVSVSCFIASS